MVVEKSDPRSGRRANVFLMAALTAPSCSGAVRVRNISAQGALLEGPALPKTGERVLLRRGSLSVSGEIAWNHENHCGIKFEAAVKVDEWTRRAGPDRQQAIDRTIAEFRGAEIGVHRLATISSSESRRNPRQVGAELLAACERIAALPNMSTELADELMKIEALARLII